MIIIPHLDTEPFFIIAMVLTDRADIPPPRHSLLIKVSLS